MRAHAILLDITHRMLAIADAPLAVDVPPGVRPLKALEAAARARLGRELETALGHELVDGDAWFDVPRAISRAAGVPVLGVTPRRSRSGRPGRRSPRPRR